MKKHFAFEFKIVSVLVLTLFMVGATGFWAYRSMHDIVKDVSEAAHPDTKLALLKQILSDLSDAESSVNSYNLTQNTDHLAPFYTSIASVDDRMEELRSLSRKDPSQRVLADSINSLVEKKYKLLNELLALHRDEHITLELRKISLNLARKEKTKKTDPAVAEEEKKRSIFSRIFNRTEIPAVAVVEPEKKETVTLDEVQHAITEAKELQSKQQAQLRDKELKLTELGNRVMLDIRALIAKAEKDELLFIAQKTRQAETRANEANLLIAFFCAAITVLLLLVSLIIIRYVHKSRRYGVALNKAKTEAENLAKARENFLANMSHEIRTPMNAIAGFTEQVLKSNLPGEQKGQLEIVKKSADHLLKIINDILDFAKIQAGKLSLEQIGFKPGEITSDVVSLMKPQAGTKGIELAHRLDADVPDVLIGDPMRFKQILLNLIGNALKFTQQGEVLVRVSTPLHYEDKVTLVLQVQDTGIGIPAEKLEHIFEEFEQADHGTSQKYGGTGLGLTITKKLAEMQGGYITLTSEVGKGTTVEVSIPYTVGSPADLPGVEPEIKINGLLKGKKILVADDETYNRMLISAMTKKWGVQITESRTGKEAYQEVLNNQYDIILMDVRMPEMDGISASSKIRKLKDEQKAKVPIIALTAVTATEDVERCKKAGMNDFLAKPFKEKELYVKMTSMLPDIGKKDHDHQPHESPAGINTTPMDKYSLTSLRALVKNDEKFFREMVDVFITSTRDGFAQMNEACSKKEWTRVADMAHKIISPCVHFEANHLVALLRQIESTIRQHNNPDPVPALLQQAEAEANAIVRHIEENHR